MQISQIMQINHDSAKMISETCETEMGRYCLCRYRWYDRDICDPKISV